MNIHRLHILLTFSLTLGIGCTNDIPEDTKPDETVEGAEESTDDERGDGTTETDSEDDPDSAPDEDEESEEEEFEGDGPGECSDDADNDRDGLFDCEDPGCAGASVCGTDSDEPIDTASPDATETDTDAPPEDSAAPTDSDPSTETADDSGLVDARDTASEITGDTADEVTTDGGTTGAGTTGGPGTSTTAGGTTGESTTGGTSDPDTTVGDGTAEVTTGGTTPTDTTGGDSGGTTTTGGSTDSESGGGEAVGAEDGGGDGFTNVDGDCDPSTSDAGALTTYYRDVDGDGYGVESDSRTACTRPSGYVPLLGDCCDDDVEAYPGSDFASDEENACGGFDYNCDGEESHVITDPGSCDSTDCTLLRSGWYGSPPACGASGGIINACSEGPTTVGTTCWPSDVTMTTAACR